MANPSGSGKILVLQPHWPPDIIKALILDKNPEGAPSMAPPLLHIIHGLYQATLVAARHRWELPVLCYHGIRGNYHYPFLGVTFSVILHDFIRKIAIKISQIVTLFSS